MIGKVNNSKLKKSLKSLTKSAEKIYDFKREKIEGINLYIPTVIDLKKYDEILKRKKEFQSCIKIMSEDPEIKKIIGKLVGTKLEQFRIGKKEECILVFIKQFFIYNREFNEIDFDLFYQKFEGLFYSSTLRFMEIGSLYNFDSKEPEIILEKGLKIKKYELPMPTPYNQFLWKPIQSDFVIEREFEMDRIIGEYRGNLIDIEKTYHLFISTIKALRILKSSGVFWDGEISRIINPFSTIGIDITTSYPIMKKIIKGPICKISKSEIKGIIKIFKSIKNEIKGRFKVAYDRLNFGIERDSPEDKLIDYMIGLEALYLPNIYDELSFRLSMRVAKTLSKKSEAEKIFNFVKSMYNLRSKIIHGGEYQIDTEHINKLEEILRKSIILGIDDKDKLSENQFNRIMFL